MVTFIEKLFNPKSNSAQITELLIDLFQLKITETSLTRELSALGYQEVKCAVQVKGNLPGVKLNGSLKQSEILKI